MLVPKREPHPFWYNFSFCKRSSLLKPLKNEKEPFYTALFHFYNYMLFHSISLRPFALSMALVFEKCLHPKKPRYAESGLG